MERKNNGIGAKSQRGFTLIELLVVISIIGLLASVVLASLNSARAKARDAKRISEFKQVQVALAFYFDKYGTYPNVSPVTTNPWTDNFNSMAQQLVTEGFLGSVPQSPINSAYNYYNYGGSVGGLLVTTLEAAAPTVVGYPGTCRPWPPAVNWCGADNTTHYCLCNPY
jgi:type II secretion system protein G